jgi:hypothetical protein
MYQGIHVYSSQTGLETLGNLRPAGYGSCTNSA